MLLDNKQIAIIGGGPGGLTLARLLQLKGAAVKVYERDFNAAVRVQGATLDLHYESGLKVMEAAGLMDIFKQTYRPGAHKGRVADAQGNILFDEHTDNAPDDDFNDEHFRPEIDRGPLRNILLHSLAPGTVVWDSQFVTMAQANGKWNIKFKNGTTAAADIVIGADGGNSKIRPFVTAIEPFYAGTIILQGNIPNAETTAPAMHRLLKGGKVYTHTDGKFIHVSAKGDGSIDFYISLLRDEHWLQNSGIDFSDHSQLVAWFKTEFPGWDSVWAELIENVSLPLLLRPQYCIPFDQSWEAQPSVTLLGDAAHLMPPSGEGVNLAMLDALELSECLTGNNFASAAAAIAAYEIPMQKRGTDEARMSLEMVAWMHSAGAMEKLVALFNQPE